MITIRLFDELGWKKTKKCLYMRVLNLIHHKYYVTVFYVGQRKYFKER
jgi:hypothetical protein